MVHYDSEDSYFYVSSLIVVYPNHEPSAAVSVSDADPHGPALKWLS
jgi:hypothetical protein